MNEPIVSIAAIVRDAHERAVMGLPVAACPYPAESAAGMRWQQEYYARRAQVRAAQAAHCVQPHQPYQPHEPHDSHIVAA